KLFVISAIVFPVAIFCAFLLSRNPKPGLPRITIETLAGLPEGTTNNPQLRLQRLFVRNTSSVALQNFCSRLQFPEPISSTLQTNMTAGTVVGWKPLMDRLSITGTGGRASAGLWVGPTSAVQ